MRARLPLALAAALCAATAIAAPSHAAASDRARIDRWSTTTEFRTGTGTDVRMASGSLTIDRGTRTLTAGGKTWRQASWTSPWSSTGHAATQLIPSWGAEVPKGTWLRVSARVAKGSKVGSWDTVAEWASTTESIKRSSSSSQSDDLASVSTDVVKAAKGTTFDRWQVRVHLVRANGSTATPKVHSVSGVASSYGTRSTPTSRTTMTKTVSLSVPQHSQMIHKGHFPEYDGGGAAWCSPTSTAMVLRHSGRGPAAADHAWAKGPDGFVDHAARHTYDHRYRGTGNWAFTAAYASTYRLDTFVTRLYDLREAEKFIKAGIPVVASIAFGRGGLKGAPLSSTPGHLLVISGFTKSGQVIVNDPAAPTNASVRRTYDRAQLEKAWLGGSGGVAYVMRPPTMPLPQGKTRW